MSAKFTNVQLVEFVKMLCDNKVPYWYGTCDYKCTEDLLQRKAKQYPAHYTSSRMEKYRKAISEKKICCDCIGMIKGFFWANGGEGIEDYLKGKGDYSTKYQSNNCPDTSANGAYEYYRKHAPKKYWTDIDDMPDIPGIAVFMSGHVGLYIGNGEVIEARGFNYGVVKTKLKDRKWKTAAMLPEDMIEYVDIDTDKKEDTKTELGSRNLKKGSEGDDVKELQQKLMALGYDLGKWGADGEFGSATLAAVKAFQKDHGLTVDGIFGKKSYAALIDGVG